MTDSVTGWKLKSHLQQVPGGAVLPGGAAAAAQPSRAQLTQVPPVLQVVAGRAMLECSSYRQRYCSNFSQ